MGTFIRRAGGLAVAIGIVAATPAARGGEMAGLDYPSFGVSLIGPKGWAGKFVVRKFVVARWEREDWEARVRRPRAVVEVRALPAEGMTLQQFADLVGRRIGGTVVDKALRVDGAPAWRLDAGEPTGDVVVGPDRLRLRGAVVVEHGGVMYAIFGGGLPWEDWRAATRQVIDRWKWIALEPPAKGLRYVEARPLLLGGRVAAPLPVGMGTADADRGWGEADDRVSLGMYNFKRGRDDFEMAVAIDERRDGETIEAYRDRLMRSLRARTADPLEWRDVPDRAARRVTPLVKVAGAPGGEATYEQYACFEQDERHAVVVKFVIAAAGQEERDFYARQAGYMLREIDVAHGAAPFKPDIGQ